MPGLVMIHALQFTHNKRVKQSGKGIKKGLHPFIILDGNSCGMGRRLSFRDAVCVPGCCYYFGNTVAVAVYHDFSEKESVSESLPAVSVSWAYFAI